MKRRYIKIFGFEIANWLVLPLFPNRKMLSITIFGKHFNIKSKKKQ